jgi:hypothetical protein
VTGTPMDGHVRVPGEALAQISTSPAEDQLLAHGAEAAGG